MIYTKQPTEKKYNEQKIIDTQCAVYDWQFKKFKNRIERERYRVEYDNMKAKNEALIQLMATQAKTPTMPKDEIARLDDEKVKMEKAIKDLEGNMKTMDDELNGVTPSSENPAGSPGIEQMIEALRDLKEVYKGYIKIL